MGWMDDGLMEEGSLGSPVPTLWMRPETFVLKRTTVSVL